MTNSAAWPVIAVEQLPTSVGGLVQYGALGIVAGLGLWFMWLAYRRECERTDRLEADNKALNTAIQDKVIPALMSGTSALESGTELMREFQRDRRERRWDHRGPDREGG